MTAQQQIADLQRRNERLERLLNIANHEKDKLRREISTLREKIRELIAELS